MKKLIICLGCKKLKEHSAKGLCSSCYWKKYDKEHEEERKKYREEHREKYRKYGERYRKENREKEKRRQRKWGDKITLKVLSHYSKGELNCACCGEAHIEFLTIDHINGREKGDNRSGLRCYKWLIDNNYPDGYQVLCMNCNFAKGRIGYCPHERERDGKVTITDSILKK